MTHSARAVAALILREISTTYGRTYGGYLWAVLEPIAAVALLTAIFSMFFEHPPLGTSFALFYATGYLPFMLYSDLSSKVAHAVRYSRPLLGYPMVNWWDAMLARALLNSATHMVVFLVVIAGLHLLEGLRVSLDPVSVGLALLLAALLGASIGALNAFLFHIAPVWERIWSVVNRPMFILSGIMFLPDALPAPYGDWLWWNPLTQIIATMRMGFYDYYDPFHLHPGAVLLAAMTCMLLALIFLGRHARGVMLQG